MKRDKSKKLSSNMEDYLEAIARLERDKGVVRVRDLSHVMGVKAPSATSALAILTRDGLVVHEKYGHIELTSSGRRIAADVQHRHDVLLKFLIEVLNIGYKNAESDACKMEHAISSATMKKFTEFMKFVEDCPSGGRPDWLENFDYFTKTGKRRFCRKFNNEKEAVVS